MKALTIHPAYAMMIVGGVKTVECRTWKTSYRGDILITSSAKKFKGTIPGHVLGVVTLTDVVPFKREHLQQAAMDYMPDVDSYAWILENPRVIKPIPIKGRLSLWESGIDYNDLEILPKPNSEEEDNELDRLYWEPLCV